MGLRGTLGIMPIPDLLQWAGGSKKTGCLQLERGGVSVHVFFREGRIIGCSSNDPPKLLGQFLIFRGVITEEVLRRSMSSQESSGSSLTEILVDREGIPRDRLNKAVGEKAEVTILGLFDWDDASFSFTEDVFPDPKAMELQIEVQDLILRGVKRLDDRARIRSVLHDPRVLLARTNRKPPAEVNEDWSLSQVYLAVNGKRTLEEIILHVHGTEFLVLEILFKLHQRGLVEVKGAPPRESRPPAAKAPAGAEPGFERAQELIAKGEPEAAIEILIAAGDAVKRLMASAEEALIRRQGLSPSKIPIPIQSRDDQAKEEISAAEDFLLKLCDGNWDIKSLIWVSPMRAVDVLTAIRSLCEKGIIELKDPSEETSQQPEESPSGIPA